jgi:hypothetical protein
MILEKGQKISPFFHGNMGIEEAEHQRVEKER